MPGADDLLLVTLRLRWLADHIDIHQVCHATKLQQHGSRVNPARQFPRGSRITDQHFGKQCDSRPRLRRRENVRSILGDRVYGMEPKEHDYFGGNRDCGGGVAPGGQAGVAGLAQVGSDDRRFRVHARTADLGLGKRCMVGGG